MWSIDLPDTSRQRTLLLTCKLNTAANPAMQAGGVQISSYYLLSLKQESVEAVHASACEIECAMCAAGRKFCLIRQTVDGVP